ncbi:thioredoxin reductase [Sphingobium sp. SCG-1]|uniref:NAD(P)/FAD-dependent oxidoreductase n=1 Tax=Sphingobium sp. SCG-1 TaxID=2072936 RepID=UPI000CD6A505|nr:NAD(P)/FAD-dependent oxidoreductase [Sphingobium sp. SCG-1]AUW57773.1 thioredoxin reductase [Sphingobium sp. SCG-1]
MHFDAIVVGGSYAGLSAAIHIARARRAVCVIDSGSPRNRFADASHGFFGQDGAEPLAMIAGAKTQVEAYPGVRMIKGEVTDVSGADGEFEVTLAGAETLTGRKLVLAFGIADILPDVPGLAERWGSSVLHCPYCHGYEHGGGKLGVLWTAPLSAHQAALIADWGATTLYLNGNAVPDTEARAILDGRGVAIESAPILGVQGAGEALSSLQLEDGREVAIDALFLAPRSKLNSPIAERLGCTLDDGPFGPVVRTDAGKLTSVPGVYAAGDIARVPHNASWAAADGVTAGISLHQSLVFAPLAAEAAR